jgi:hypothetical protein
MTSPSMMLKFIEMSDFVRACGSKHDDARKTSCRTFSTVPKNQHSLGTLAEAAQETRLRGAKDIEVFDLLGLKSFPFMPGPIDRVEKRTYVPMHDVQDKDLGHPMISRLVIFDEHRA